MLSVNYWYLMALFFNNFNFSIFSLSLSLALHPWHLELLIFKLCLFSNYFSSCCVAFMSWKLLNEIHIWLNALISQKACFPDLCIHRSECQSVTSLCISKVLFFFRQRVILVNRQSHITFLSHSSGDRVTMFLLNSLLYLMNQSINTGGYWLCIFFLLAF